MPAELEVKVTFEDEQNVVGPLALIVGLVVVFPTVTFTGAEVMLTPVVLVTTTV